MAWLNDILKNFGWDLTASLTCCGEPAEDSPEYKTILKQAYAAGAAFTKE